MRDRRKAIGETATFRGARRWVAVALAVLAGALLLVPNLADAQISGIGISVTPAFTSPVTVGQQNQPALIQFVNGSFGGAALETLTLTNVRINTSCATSAVDPTGPSPCPIPEPRPDPTKPILTLDPSSTAGTTCPGGPFVITGPDAEGDYTFTPTTGPLTLAPVGTPGSSCVITFTFDVVQRPNDGSTFQAAAVTAVSPSFPGGVPQTGASQVVVNQATPAIATLVSPAAPGGGTPTVPIGTTFTDSATVTGVANGPTPTGTVSFSYVFDPPGAATCTGSTTVLTPPSPLSGPAPTPPTPPTATATSPAVTAGAAGTYHFVATYSGDVNYAAPPATACGAPGENVTVTQLILTLATAASTNSTTLPSGTTVSDTTTLTPPAGGPVPTGTVTYTLVGPNPDATCTAPVAGTATVPAGTPSGPFTVTLPGTYNFVATYSGDATYQAITTPVGCGVAAERFTVAPVPIPLTTQASTNSTSVVPGTVVTDTAAFTPPAGFPAPTGTVTYTLVGPNPNATCTAPVVGAPSTVAVGAPSAGFTVTAPGTYNFVATYSGDANYLPVSTPVGCGVPAERFTVATLPIGLTTQASTNAPNVAPGTAVTDTAVFTPPAGGPAPTGTVTYTLVGPNPNATCTSPVVGAPSTTTVGTPSASYVVTAPGTYNFVATYSGDVNYAPITTPVGCGAASEIFTVALQPLTITTQSSTNSTTVPPGTGVTDTAAFTLPPGGPTPTGTVTYTLVGPNPDVACTGPVVGTSTVGAGSASGAFAVTSPGAYNFLATYSGDAFYSPITTPVGCGVPAERFTVVTQTATLATQASTNSTTVPPGTTVTDTATVTPPAGGPPPTGTVTYTLVGPNPNATCTGPVVGTSTTNVGQASGPFTPTAVGTYNFVATYSGDANYSPITTPVGCGVAGETFAVAPRPIGLTTLASTNSRTVAPGAPVTDTATFTPPAGGPAPTGTVTYTLVGPNPDATCTTPVFGAPNTAPVGSPSPAFSPTAPGTYNFVATYSGDANYAAITTPVGCGDPNEIFAIALQPVNLATTASTNATNVLPGATVTDTATLTPAPGGPTPTGTVTYTLVGPNPDPACAGPAVGTASTVAVGAASAPFTVTMPGAYNFLATYSGDAFYAPITTPVGCNIPAERFAVTLAPPAIVTQASPSVPVGGAITDTATLSGGLNPTGTITFTVFGPGNTNCTGTPLATSTRTVNGNGDYTSAPFTTTAAGAYRWIATYSGDVNNAPAGPTACADPAETNAGLKVTPSLVTVASAGAVGGQVFDTATLSGAFNPTGTITFQLFNNETCTGAAIFTSTRPVTGNGNVVSDSFILPAPGTYHFVATYSGDANNNPVGPTACLDTNEAVGVGRLPIGLATQASPGVVVGNTIADTATITGAFNPTGTVTFTLFGPDNANCTGTPIFTSVKPVNGNGTIPSDSFTPTAPGVYRWIATYSGDANNAPFASPCNAANESVTVTPLPTIAIEKTASPLSLPVPGGTFTFNLVVTNTSNVALTIRTLTDNIYGDVTVIPGSTCNTAIGTVLAPSPGPGNTYSCHFPGDFRGPAGASQTDVATVTATDILGNTVRASDNAVVTITPVPPSITTVKSAAPPSLQEPGGTFTFNYSVTNTGPEAVTITSIVDDVYGDLNGRGTCAVGARLAPNGGTYSCTFTGSFFGDAGAAQTDTITTIGRNDRGEQVVSKASATVTITNVAPSIQIIKTPDPTSRPEPGGTFRFTLVVTNTSFEAITTTSLVDNIYGDLNGRGSCAIGVVLAPNGGRYSCAFDGDFHGKAGDSQTDTVTVVAVDNENTSVTAKASATVTLTPVNVTPSIQVTKTPEPTSRPAPGGSFRFTVVVTNTSSEPITTTSLVDDVYGDLNGRGSCATGIVLAANGGRYSCAFDGDFRGKAGDSQTDTVTVVAVDSHNISVTAKASATVTLTPVNVPPVFQPPAPLVVPPVTPAPVVQQVLVRTGADALRQARVAIVLLLLGMILVWASWRFGFGNGLEFAPAPSGPRGPRGGPRRPGGGAGFGEGSWFGPTPPHPPVGPLAGLGAISPAPPRSEPEPEAVTEPPAVTRASALPPSAFTDVIDRASWTRPIMPPEPDVLLPTEVLAPAEVLLPTEVVFRPSGGLDAAALDAANAATAQPMRPNPPAGSGTHHRRGRKFGGR